MSQFTQQTLISIPSPEQVLAEIKPQIRSMKSFQTGKVNKYGKVVGINEYPKGKVPFERQDHHYDEQGNAVYFEKFVREFSKPSVRCYWYKDGMLDHAVWFDRYGVLENLHVYLYDDLTGLLCWRAEYDHEGKLFYSIKSKYDSRSNLTEEIWLDNGNRFMKKYVYTYHPSGLLASESRYNHGGTLDGFHYFVYDKKGNMTERRWYSARGEVLSRFAYTFDPKDRVTKLQLYGPGDVLQTSQDFGYDEVGNVLRERLYDEKGRVVKDLRYPPA